MNIGFDLDGILVDKPPFIPKEIIERLHKTDGKQIKYRIPSVFEQYIRKISHHPVFRPSIKKNILFISTLKKKNIHTCYLISGRFGFIAKETERIIHAYKLNILFKKKSFNYNNNQPHLFKNTMIRKLGIHVFVDDDLDLLKFLSKENPKINFFWFNKKNYGKLQKNLFAISHLSQIFKK